MPYSNKHYLQELSRKQQLDIMKVDFFNEKTLEVLKIDDGYVLPPIFGSKDGAWFIGGVLDKNKGYVEISGQKAYGETDRVYGKYDFNDNDVEYIDEEVIYLNFYLSQWGHYLLDVIGRLWYIVKNTNYKIIYTTDLGGNNHIKNNFLELIKLLGIDENRLLFINKVTKFKNIIVPEMPILVAKYYTKEYKELIDLLVDNALKGYELKKDRKVYCSRHHFVNTRSKEYGEEIIEKVFKDNGYEIVYMEELDLISQIRLLNECKEIVCISGTLVHNAMFIRNKDCNFTVLNKTYKVNPNIYVTNELSEANITFVDTYLAPLPISIGKGPFIIVVTNEFINYCKDKNLIINNKQFNKNIIKKYYIDYFVKYRKKLLKHEKVSSSGLIEYDVSDKEIRKHYKNEIKTLNNL